MVHHTADLSLSDGGYVMRGQPVPGFCPSFWSQGIDVIDLVELTVNGNMQDLNIAGI